MTLTTYRLVLHGRTGHTPVEFIIIHDAVFNQGLNRHFVLKQQEAVAYKASIKLGLFVYFLISISTQKLFSIVYTDLRNQRGYGQQNLWETYTWFHFSKRENLMDETCHCGGPTSRHEPSRLGNVHNQLTTL